MRAGAQYSSVGKVCAAMSEGLKTTFRLLASTSNEAASQALIAALDSSHVAMRRAALQAILTRRSLIAHREVVARLHTFDEASRALIAKNPTRMSPALREALIGTDLQCCLNACSAAVWLQLYDLLPALLNALEGPSNPNDGLVAKTLRELVDLLSGDPAELRDGDRRRDPQITRYQAIGSLELSLGRFVKHGRREVVEALVQLAPCDNPVLREILDNNHHAAFPVLTELLTQGDDMTLVRLLLGFLDDPATPQAVISIVARRSDAKFVGYFLRKIGRQPTTALAQNLKRVISLPWASKPGKVLDDLDDMCQHAAVRLAMLSSIPREQSFAIVNRVLRHGKVGGRRAAAEALDKFQGADANMLVLRALEDSDPEVLATLLPQLRRRGIPGALGRLVGMLDSQHAAVRKAVRKGLSEFSFQRYLRTFDTLDEEVRRSTGELVKKVDPNTVPQLRAEMALRVRSRRLRALAMVRVLELAPKLEGSILRLLADEDHMVRADAASTLAACRSDSSRDALWEALGDRSLIVQESARCALEDRGEPLPAWPAFPLPGEGESL